MLNGCTKEIYDSDRYLSSKEAISLSSEVMALVTKPFKYHLLGDDLSSASLDAAIEQSIAYYKKIPADSLFYYGNLKYTATELILSMELFKNIIATEQRYDRIIERLESDFFLFKSIANDYDDGVLFTGYFEPIFEGSLTRTEEYNVPVYTIPDDLVVLNLGYFRDSLKNRTIVYRVDNNNVVPYFTRQEIMEKGVLVGKHKEIAWMKNPIDLFFLQIQGSGILRLPSGKKIKLSYQGSNGHRYSSIGKLLVDEEIMKLEDVSMQSIRQYLNDNPASRDRILYHNKSYTFFELEETNEGPRGNIDVPLTPHRSIAIDSFIFPKGSLAYVKSELPVFTKNWKEYTLDSFSRFVLVQDTGGAIRGPGRVDLFWGNGKLAEKSAGMMRSYGKLYFLVAKPEALQKAMVSQLSN